MTDEKLARLAAEYFSGNGPDGECDEEFVENYTQSIVAYVASARREGMKEALKWAAAKANELTEETAETVRNAILFALRRVEEGGEL